MKVSKTLTNEELTVKVLDELEDIIISVCRDVVEGIDTQLRKGYSFLDYGQREALIEHLREKVNLNLTINAGIFTKDLASIDICPRDMRTKGLESFIEEEEKHTESNDSEKENIILRAPDETLEEFEERKRLIEEEQFRAERTARAEAQA